MIHSGNHEELICELYPFMTSNKEIRNTSCKKEFIKDNIYLFSRNNDNLMYCIYLAIKNTLDINKFKTNYNNIFPFLKENAISKCKADNGLMLKTIKQSKNDFINYIFSTNKLDWNYFYGMCFYNDMVIIAIKNKIAYIYGDMDIHSVKGYITINDNHTSFDMNLKIILDDFFIIKNPLKPIRAISNYKIDELKTICHKLDITYDNMNKNEIYSAICKVIIN